MSSIMVFTSCHGCPLFFLEKKTVRPICAIGSILRLENIRGLGENDFYMDGRLFGYYSKECVLNYILSEGKTFQPERLLIHENNLRQKKGKFKWQSG